MSLVNLAHVCSHLQNASLARLGLTSIPYTRLHLSLALLLHKQGFISQVKLAGASPPPSCFPPGVRESVVQRGLLKAEKTVASRQDQTDSETAAVVDEDTIDFLVQNHTKSRDDLQAEGKEEHQIDLMERNRRLVSEALSMIMQRDGNAQNLRQELHRALNPESLPSTTAVGPSTPSEPQDLWQLEEEGVVTQANRASRRLWLGLKYWDGQPVLKKARMISKPTKRIELTARDLGKVIRGSRAGEVKPMTQIGEIMAVSTSLGLLEARECVERRTGGMVLCRIW